METAPFGKRQKGEIGRNSERNNFFLYQSGFIVDDSYHSWRMRVESVWKDDLHVQL